MDFTAGQHVCVGPPNGIHTREYSIYSPEDAPYIEILVKEVQNGLVTPAVITSYSIHYTKLYDGGPTHTCCPAVKSIPFFSKRITKVESVKCLTSKISCRFNLFLLIMLNF